ncbi:type II secretion system protein [Clostridium akagii]|uniref:type II secretion system protein n=1 Tax=Clostridium akagii TaxID=91623 RepID=UPI00047DCB44|nr:prepilin-type N-terminal cleavage/methylation domain-containing protein [Clostridium akagii]
MKHKGMTLIELIIVMAIFAIFSLAVYNYQSGELNVYRKLSVQTTLQGDAKNAVEQITFDIKKSRLTPYSVETDFSDAKFHGLLGSNYTPIVYIDFLNTDAHDTNYNSCIYAVKQLANGTKELVKIFLRSNEFTLDTNHINIADENIYGTNSYSRGNYNTNSCTTFDQSIVANILPSFITIVPVLSNGYSFIYEEQGNYYLVHEVSGSEVEQYNLKQESSVVNNIGALGSVSEKVIVSDVNPVMPSPVQVNSTDLGQANSLNNSFNISISLSKNINLNGRTTLLSESFNANATRLRYDGGDENAGN